MNPFWALVIANVIWGAASPVFKFSLENIPPFTLAFIRFFFAGTIYMLFVVKHWRPLTWRQFAHICLGGFFGITINISFFFLGLPKTNSINAPVIASMSPIFLYLISIFFLRERPHRKVLIGILVSFIGAMIIIFAPYILNGSISIEQKKDELLGNLFLVVATLGSIGQAIVHKKILHEVHVMQVTLISFFFGALNFLPLAFFELNTWSLSQLDYRGWTGIVFGVFFSSALAYGLFIYGITKIKAQEIGLFTYIDPIVAVVIAIPLLGEIPNLLFYVGSALIFIGIVFAENRFHWHPIRRL